MTHSSRMPGRAQGCRPSSLVGRIRCWGWVDVVGYRQQRVVAPDVVAHRRRSDGGSPAGDVYPTSSGPKHSVHAYYGPRATWCPHSRQDSARGVAEGAGAEMVRAGGVGCGDCGTGCWAHRDVLLLIFPAATLAPGRIGTFPRPLPDIWGRGQPTVAGTSHGPFPQSLSMRSPRTPARLSMRTRHPHVGYLWMGGDSRDDLDP